MFDLTDRRTYIQVDNWINLIKEKGEKDVQVFLVGNKSDLCTS